MPISLSSWSFHEALYSGHMRLWDVPVAAARLGFQTVELQDLFLCPFGNRVLRAFRRLRGFGSSPPDREYDPKIINRLTTALRQNGVHCHVWDADPEFGAHTPNFEPVAYTIQAMHTASRLGASIVRITIDHDAVGHAVQKAVDPIQRLISLAERLDIRLAVENHSPKTDPHQMVHLIQAINSPYVGVCLDFGNIQSQADFAMLAPYTIHVHAKCYEFNAAGQETTIPFDQRFQALVDIGYQGSIAIEYEGDGSPEDAIQTARVLIENARRNA